jgi:succinyl-diaminopimelate desuccinylase
LLDRLLHTEPRDVVVNGHVFREVASVTLARGGRARNVVPDRFDLNLNFRFAPGRSVEEAQDEVRALVGGGAAVEFTDLAPAGRVVGPENELFARLVAATGATVAAKQAWTDVARLSAAGIDAVNFGPGGTAQAHQAGEYIDVAELRRGFAMLRSFLEGG